MAIGVGYLLIKVHFGQKEIGDTSKSLFRPFSEPIDSAAIDQRGKHAQTCAEGFADGTARGGGWVGDERVGDEWVGDDKVLYYASML